MGIHLLKGQEIGEREKESEKGKRIIVFFFLLGADILELCRGSLFTTHTGILATAQGATRQGLSTWAGEPFFKN